MLNSDVLHQYSVSFYSFHHCGHRLKRDCALQGEYIKQLLNKPAFHTNPIKNRLDIENTGIPPLVFIVRLREILSFMNMGLEGISQRCRVWYNFAYTLLSFKLSLIFRRSKRWVGVVFHWALMAFVSRLTNRYSVGKIVPVCSPKLWENHRFLSYLLEDWVLKTYPTLSGSPSSPWKLYRLHIISCITCRNDMKNSVTIFYK